MVEGNGGFKALLGVLTALVVLGVGGVIGYSVNVATDAREALHVHEKMDWHPATGEAINSIRLALTRIEDQMKENRREDRSEMTKIRDSVTEIEKAVVRPARPG